SRHRSRRTPPCRRRAPPRPGCTAPPTPAAPRSRSARPSRTRRAAGAAPLAAEDRRGGRTPSACPRRAVRRGLPRPERPKRPLRRGARLGLGGRLLARRRLLRGRPVLLAVTGEDVIEPLGRFLLVHVLRVHQLGREDLLGLDEHLLFARGETLLVVAQ